MSNTNANIDFEYLTCEESEEELGPVALELVDHIVEILAAEYIESMREPKEEEKTP